MREDEVYPRWVRYRGSITWRKSSRTVSSRRPDLGAVLQLLYERLGSNLTPPRAEKETILPQKPTREDFDCFPHWFAWNLYKSFLKMAICCPQCKVTLCQKSHRWGPKLCHICVKVVLRLSYAENQGWHVLVKRKAKIFTANSFWLSRNQWKHTILAIPPLVANWAIWSLVIA